MNRLEKELAKLRLKEKREIKIEETVGHSPATKHKSKKALAREKA